ncbi:MAG: winged helix-turn-helix transcriptional regulator [Clostridiales bacterium]|jgi:predicted ArsR family transcriptional regulator|nr:winged helix-turn-helix transcriptional regulator [Clostridiales bacterium]
MPGLGVWKPLKIAGLENPEIADFVGISPDRTRSYLKKLVNIGKIKKRRPKQKQGLFFTRPAGMIWRLNYKLFKKKVNERDEMV